MTDTIKYILEENKIDDFTNNSDSGQNQFTIASTPEKKLSPKLTQDDKQDGDSCESDQASEKSEIVFENIENHFKNVIQNNSNSEPLPSESLSTDNLKSVEDSINNSEPNQESKLAQETSANSDQIESNNNYEENSSAQQLSSFSEFSDYNISPEPDNLLEKLAPSSFDAQKTEGRPDLIQETLTYLSELSTEPSKTKSREKNKPVLEKSNKKELHMSSEHVDDVFVKIVGEHVKRILERSLAETIAREISGLSKTIERSVKEVVKEVTPEITRSIIKEEIEKIRKLEEV